MSAPISVACPLCWAKPGDRCRTTTTHRTTDTHDARFTAAAESALRESDHVSRHLPKMSPVRGCICIWCRAARGPVGL